VWDYGDDMKLLKALEDSGVAFDHEVNWGTLVPGRKAVDSHKRWKLMLTHLQGWRAMSFRDVVSHLSHLAEKDM
jgi:hypothetical protein